MICKDCKFYEPKYDDGEATEAAIKAYAMKKAVQRRADNSNQS